MIASLALRVWMALPQPNPSRFWDERYALANVAQLLEEGTFEPANAFHPSLAHLPQAAVLGVAQTYCRHAGSCADPIVEGGRFSPLAYHLARWLQAVYGALSLVALFLVGRRLFDPAVGLAAAALLAMVPWHVRQSVLYKPDILLLLLLIVAFAAALRVAERPDWRRFGLAGAMVGLATAAKYIGLTAAIPLFLGTVAGLRRQPRRLAYLALAGVVAVAVFALLNPHLVLDLGLVQRDFGVTLRDYARKGSAAGARRASLGLHAVTTLLSAPFHGALVGGLALAGLLVLGVTAFDRGRDAWEREGRRMLVGFPLLYVVVYAFTTTNPSAHNWLPLTPFTSLAAAWLGVTAWRRLALRLPERSRRTVSAALLVLLVATSLGVASHYAYFATVPTTVSLARGHLLHLLPRDLLGRLVFQEAEEGEPLRLRRDRRNKPAVVTPEALAGPLAEGLAGVDALVLPGGGEPGGAGASASPPGQRREFRPHPFEAWGPPLVVVLRPWRRSGPAVPTPGGEGAYSVPPPPRQATHLSFRLAVSGAMGAGRRPLVRFEGRDLQAFWFRSGGRQHHFATERVAVPTTPGPWPAKLVGLPADAAPDLWRMAWRRPPATAEVP